MDDWLTDRILTHVCHHAPTQYRHGYWINFGNSRRRKTQFQSLASCRIGSAREKLLRQFQCQAWGVSHRVSSVRRSFAAACRLSQLLQLRCKYLLHFCDSLRSASKCSICRSDRLPVRQTTCKQTRRGIIKSKCINLNESLAVFVTNFLVAGSASSLVCWLLCSALPSSPSAHFFIAATLTLLFLHMCRLTWVPPACALMPRYIRWRAANPDAPDRAGAMIAAQGRSWVRGDSKSDLSQTSCRTGSTAPCAESHSPSLTPAARRMHGWIHRCSAYASTWTGCRCCCHATVSRGFQQNQKCLKNKRRFADFNLFDFVACVD